MTVPSEASASLPPSRGRRPVNVAVLGLGARWRKLYGPALHSLHDRFRVRAVCDPVQEWADQEARRLGCVAAAGPTELLQTEDVDALLLLDAPWYRLWPLELACRLGKPVFCALPLELDEAHADALRAQVREDGLVVMMALTPALAPAAGRLRRLLDEQLGPPRSLLCDWAQPGPVQRPAAPLLGTAGGAVLDCCLSVFGTAPSGVLATEAPAAGLASVLLEFPDGRAAQIVRRRVPGRRGSLRLQVVAEKGQGTAALPARVSWTDDTGRHRHVLPPPGPAGRLLLERFYRAVAAGGPAEPGLEQAFRTLACLRAIARSRAEGRRVAVADTSA